MDFQLKNRTALITGASGLLGVEHAKALLDIGANVILTDVNESKLRELKEHFSKVYSEQKVDAYVMDVSEESSVSSVLEALKAQNRTLEILINNAAIDPKVDGSSTLLEQSRLENFSLKSWNLQVGVGLTGAFLCSKYFGSYMAERNIRGVILNIASDLSVFSPDQRLYKKEGLEPERQPVKPVTYSVIKTGLIGLTRYLATYWADKGIRVNALSPGGVFNNQPAEFVSKLSQLIPLGRMAKREEYHGAIQFLCSDASSYITGQNIVADGGRSVW